MPSRPQRPCKRPGCPALVDKGYCEAHAESAKSYDKYRGTAGSRGYDSDWKRVRIEALKRDRYLCLHCLAKGIVTPAKDVDHILTVKTHPWLRLVLSNLQSLCRACHVKKTNADRGQADQT
jgi:5-methylcytosine-specific restriction protein A